MKSPILFLLVVSSLPVSATTYTDAASGNWCGTPANWSPSGTPGDGDTVNISGGHSITINCSIGTTGGGGIHSILIGSNNASELTIDGLGAYTITFASASKLGGTQGKIDFSPATPTNSLTLQGATSSTEFQAYGNGGTIVGGSPAYSVHYRNVYIGQGLCGPSGNYCFVGNTSLSCTSCFTWEMEQIVVSEANAGSATGIFGIISSAPAWTSGNPNIHDNVAINRGAIPMLYTAANPCTPWHFDYNADYEPASTTYFVGGNIAPCGLTATGNEGYDLSTDTAGFIANLTGGTTSTAAQFAYNAWRFDPAGQTTNGFVFQFNCGSTGPCIFTNNMASNFPSAISLGASTTTTWNGTWLQTGSNTLTAQGAIFVSGGTHVLNNTMCSWTSVNLLNSNANMCVFCYATSSNCTVNRTSDYLPAQGAANQQYGTLMGDYGNLPVANALVRNNLYVNAGVGIADYGGSGSNTWAPSCTDSAGSCNNLVYNSPTPYYTDCTGGSCSNHFQAGSTPHPNAVYGDITPPINPALIAPLRGYAAADAFLGGPGTELHLFQQVIGTQTPLVAVLGVAGGLSANQLYTPQAIYQFLAAGFALTSDDSRLTTGAQDGSYIGAVKPLCMGCWIP